MTISQRELNRATLDRQLLLGRQSLDVRAAVLRVIALQAQHAASPYVALWNRLTDFDPADLDRAFADRTIVKSNMVRMTLHAVHEDDYQAFREATEPSIRAARLYDPRFKSSGLTLADADALVPELQEFAEQPHTGVACADWLAARVGTPDAWWGMRQYTPLLHVPTGDPWSFGHRASYVAPKIRPVLSDPDVVAKSLETVILRYLTGFGPASVADMALFGMIQRSRIKVAVKALADDLDRLTGPNGEELFDVPGAPRPDADTPAPPRLLGMWDNTLLAYAVRDRVIPPDYRKTVIRVNGDVLPTLLVDGQVVGVWRAVEDGIEATAFQRLPKKVWAHLAAEARSLVALLADRDPTVYSRYHHWWAKLSGGETRMLP